MKKIIFLIFVFLLTSCLPRGESKSLDQVFDLALKRFDTAYKSADNENLPKEVQSIKSNILRMLEANPKKNIVNSKSIYEDLNTLIYKAGYTVRPGMNELIKQYSVISQSGCLKGTCKLIAARTLNNIASELETTAFKFSE